MSDTNESSLSDESLMDLSSLYFAFDNLYHSESNTHPWTGAIGEDTPSIDIEGIYVQGFGAIKFPPTLKSLTSVTEALRKEGSASQCCRIDGSKIYPIPKRRETVAQMAHELACDLLGNVLDIDLSNLNANFHATLDAFVICEKGQSYRKTLFYRREPGAFATLVLQIPLESSQPSGRLVLRDGFKEIKTDNLAPNGQSNHNVALLFSSYDCLQVKNYCIQADTGDGVVAAMIFNLICTEYFSLSRYFHIDCYPKLLIIADRIAKALKSRQGIAALSQNQRDGSDEDQSDSYTTISLDSHETSRFFCVPIKNLSSENQFKEFNQYDLGPCGLAVSLIANEIVKFTEATLAFISADIQLSDQELPFDDNGVFSLSDLSLLEEPPIFNFIDPENLPWQVRYVTTNIEDLFTRSISIDQIVETLWCNEYKRSDDLINIPVLVVRSRRSNFKGCKNNFQSSYSEANQSAARLLDEAETFLARHEVELSKNDARPSLVASLLSNLDCVVDILIANSENDTDSSPDYCLEWLSIRALNICTFLKASNQGFAVLDNLAKMSFFETIGLDCACSGHDFPTHTIIASFIRFTCYDQGGSEKTHPTDRFTQLITDNMSEENCLSYPILGIELFLQDCIEEARFIVDRVLHIMVENQFPLVEADSEGDLEGTKLIDLALYLYGEQGDRVSDGTFKQMLTLSGYVPESELVALVEYLCQLIEDGTLDSTEFLIKLSNPIIETGLHRFTSKNFLRMVQLYEKHTDHDMVKLFWEKVCSDCIANSESKLPCVFCKILTEALPDYAERDEVLRTVSRASNAKQAISSSSKKFNPAVQENAAECFIYSISMLNDVAQLSDDDQLNTVLSNLLPTMDSKTLCQVGWFLFTSKTGVFDKQSTMRRVFEDVLRRITSLEGIGETYIFKAFRMFAWLGDLNLLETIYAKILREKNQCPTPKKEMCLVRLVFSALKGCIAGQTSDAASALNFNRKVFNFLLSRCVASVEVLEYSRASSFSRAFKAFLKAEKNFIDSSEASVTDAFSRVAHRLTPFEAMKIIKVLYLHESSNGHVEPSLKKFPPCWQVFQQLSRKAIDHFTQKPFSSTRFSANDAVTLMHCFFYVGEEEQIAKFCEFVCAGDTEEPRVGLRLCNIDKRIIMHSDTVPLALATPHGTVALMELIGNRIQRLTRRLCKNNHKGHEKEIQSLKSLRRTILLCIIQGKDTSKGKDVHV